jgi:hypothetical protein
LHEDREFYTPIALPRTEQPLVAVHIKCRSGKRGVRDGGKEKVSSSCRQSNPGSATVVSQNMHELRRLREMCVYKPISFLFSGSVKLLCTVANIYGSHGTSTGRYFLRLRYANRSYSKTNQMHLFLKLFVLAKHSTCFGRFFRPSSLVQDCTYSSRHMSNRYCYLLLAGTLAAGSSICLTYACCCMCSLELLMIASSR